MFTLAFKSTVSVLNFVGKIFVVYQKYLFVSVLNFVGINFHGLILTPSKVESLTVDDWSLAYGVTSCGGLNWIVLQSYHVVILCRISVH